MPDPKQSNLQPVESSDTGNQPKPQLQPVEAIAPEPTGQKPHIQSEQPKETEVAFMKGGSTIQSAFDDMNQILKENPKDVFNPPVEPDDDQTPIQNTDQPEPGKEGEPPPGQKPVKDDGLIEVNGRKMTRDQLAQSYKDLNKEFHKNKFVGQQEKRNLQLKLAELDTRLKERDKLIESQTLSGPNGNNQNGETILSQEDFDKLVEDGKTVEGVKKIAQTTVADALNKNSQQVKVEANKVEIQREETARIDNLATMNTDFDSFVENQAKFADWADDRFGTSEVGQRAIEETVGDLPRLKLLYATYLKDNYDFSGKISQARNDGQSIAQVKESLQPVSSSGGKAPNPNAGPSQPKLEPVDEGILQMEEHLGPGNLRSPSFFKR